MWIVQWYNCIFDGVIVKRCEVVGVGLYWKLIGKGVFTWENSHRREFHTGMTFLCNSCRVYMMNGSFHISLFEGTLNVDKMHNVIQNRRHYACATCSSLPQTDFIPKLVVVSRLHDTVARFRIGVKFSPPYKNRGELTPGWLAPAWHFVVVSCKQI